jgi:glucokinase
MKSFTCKGRFKEMLGKMEVKVSLNPEAALIGAVNFAKERL